MPSAAPDPLDSTTPDIDKAIEAVQKKLDETQVTKEWLAVMDRMQRLLAMKYKFGSKGKGSRFTRPGGSGG
jgi:hypothetical protein